MQFTPVSRLTSWAFVVAVVGNSYVGAFVPKTLLTSSKIHEISLKVKETPADVGLAFPHPDLNAVEVTTFCMDSLKTMPSYQSLEVCFNFSSDRCRAAVGGSLEQFIQYAANPIFGALVNCDNYEIVSIGPVIPSGKHRGAMQTVLLDIQRGITMGDALRAAQKKLETKRLTAEERAEARRQERMQKEKIDNDEKVVEEDGKLRFLWTLQQERRPPRQDCWLIHEVLFIKNAFELTL